MPDVKDFFIKYYELFKNSSLDPGFIHQWYLFEANVIQAWNNFGFGSEEVVIAVIDLDFDIEHPDFKDKLHKPFDSLYGQPASIINNQPVIIDKPFKNVLNSAHGTACASLALAAQDGKGIIGVAPNVKFMPIRIMGASDDTWESAFRYAVANGAHIISCSLGYDGSGLDDKPLSSTISTLIQTLSKDVIFCFASGNASKQSVGFSSHPDVIGVGACTVFNKLAAYSNTNSNTIITAPSSDDEINLKITVSDILGDSGDTQGDLQYSFGGTSAACPLVAGVIGLMVSQNRKLKVAEVKNILIQTGSKLEDGHHVKINGYEAVKEVRKRLGVENFPIAGSATIDLNIRKGPAKIYEKVGSVKKGEDLTFIAYENGWYKIEENKYISGRYITLA